MKIIARLFVLTLILTFAMSTVSLADGGSPPPMCSPGHCTTTIPS
jgi:hypothetical protein